MLQALRRRWFLLLIVVTLAVGITWAEELAPLSNRLPRNMIVGSVLLAMALPLQLRSIWSTVRRPGPALLAVSLNLLVVPVLAWCASWLLIEELAMGMIIAASVPCTLASAAVWTRMAGGNDAVSLLVTLITNLSCFFVTPGLIWIFSGQTDSSLSFSETALKLLLLIVLPMVVAQLLRTILVCRQWATENKQALGTFAQIGLISIVFIGAVNCGLSLKGLGQQLSAIAGQIVLMLVLVAVVHLVAWWLGFWSAGRLGVSPEDQLAVAFSGSQKTLMVGLAVALAYGGLTVLPMLAYHVEQLLIDTWLAGRFSLAARE